MEKLIMRKHLIGTILVLAALAACNKEVETPATVVDNGQEEVTPGKVTLTFKATINEGTRTSYDADLNGSWVAGDAITVCVTNGTKYETKDFTTKDGEIFSGEVSDGYTTIVSGVYPADNRHVFTAGAVTSVYLPEEYNLFDLDDEGNPISSFNDTGIALPMVGAMDENDNFVFHHICGALKIEVIDIFNALTFTTAGEKIAGLFSLNSDGHIALNTAAETATDNVTFNYGRLSNNPAEGERLNRTFYIPVPDGNLSSGATMALKNSTGKVAYEKTTSKGISFGSNIIKRLPAITLHTPTGWANSVTEVEEGQRAPYTHTVPEGTSYFRLFRTKTAFNNTYHGSVAAFIEDVLFTQNGYLDTQTFYTDNPIENYYGKDYIVLSCGVNHVDKTDRQLTFEYCLLEYSFEYPAYKNWLGTWIVNDGTNTDTWTITRKESNKTYNVTGLCGNTTNQKTVEALYSSGKLRFKSQYDFATATFGSVPYQISLVMFGTGAVFNSYEPYYMMEAAITSDNISLSSLQSRYSKYNLVRRETHDSGYINYGKVRNLPATMTKQ